MSNEEYQFEEHERREKIEWTNILAASKHNPVLAELVKELKTVYELSGEKSPEEQPLGSWAGIVLDG